jgi:hypothetical protein
MAMKGGLGADLVGSAGLNVEDQQGIAVLGDEGVGAGEGGFVATEGWSYGVVCIPTGRYIWI